MAAPWEDFATADGPWLDFQKPKPGVAEDIARTVPAAAVRSAANVVGAPAGIMDLVDTVWQQAVSRGLQAVGALTPEQAAKARQPIPGLEDGNFRGVFPRASLLTKATEKAVGEPLYKPQTTTGEYVNTAIEMAPAALLPGTVAQRVGQVAVPALTSETAGQVARRVAPAAEPAARLVGAVGGSVGASIAQQPRTAQAIIRESAPNLDEAAINQARALMDDAAVQGVALTWPEAIQQVTGGATRLTDIQRVVENSRGGGEVMRQFMAERPAQVAQAGNRAIGGLADNPMQPVPTGLAVRRAAETEVDDAQRAVNDATRPLYQAAERQSVGPQVAQALAADPIYAATLHEIRNNPALNATIANLPDDAVGVVDLVSRRMREAGDAARMPGQANTSNLAAANYETARRAPVEAAEQATGGQYGDYAQARATQETLRREFLEPLTEGPLGGLASSNDVMAQARALLPNQPAAGLDAAVSQTVRRVARQNPDAAQNLVRTYAQTVFDEAIQNNATGPNAFGGAKFAAVIAGNPQQARNLEAAVRALPNGNQRWDGFQRFLEVAEATGQRQQTGSATAFNEAIKDQLKRGTITGEVATATTGAGLNIPSRIARWYEELRMGRNTEQLARIFTDPAAEGTLRELARAAPGTPRAQALALRLTYIAGASP
jgi:hypothetical protein